MAETTPQPETAGLTALFRAETLLATLMLGGGIALHAVETYITATLMPSIVRDIGGLSLFAWATTLYVIASVVGSIYVAVRPAGVSLNRCYVAGAVLFGAGSLVCALAPVMEIVLAGRAVQGLGAGLLVTLGYAFIRFVYPEALWSRASTLYAAVWGIATFVGPSIGGIFASGSAWREAFLILVPIALTMAYLAPRRLPQGEDRSAATHAAATGKAVLAAPATPPPPSSRSRCCSPRHSSFRSQAPCRRFGCGRRWRPWRSRRWPAWCSRSDRWRGDCCRPVPCACPRRSPGSISSCS